MFRMHVIESMKKKVKPLRVDLCVIPGGLTSMLQPLDVFLNKPFKDRVRRLWNEWISSGDVKLTKGGNMMKPNITLCCQWVRQAWNDIPAEMVKKSFLKCGISNAMNESEDDAIFKESEKQQRKMTVRMTMVMTTPITTTTSSQRKKWRRWMTFSMQTATWSLKVFRLPVLHTNCLTF